MSVIDTITDKELTEIIVDSFILISDAIKNGEIQEKTDYERS